MGKESDKTDLTPDLFWGRGHLCTTGSKVKGMEMNTHAVMLAVIVYTSTLPLLTLVCITYIYVHVG